MTKRLIFSFAASLVVMTGIAVTPVKAQSNEELGRTIAGAITLFILGNALVDTLDKDDKSKKTGVKSGNTANSVVSGRPYSQPWGLHDRPTRGRYGVHPLKVVSMQCYFTINQRHRQNGVFGERCLRDTTKKFDWLPRECRMVIPVRHGQNAAVYDAQCLREFGWRAQGYRSAGQRYDDDDDDHGRGRRH